MVQTGDEVLFDVEGKMFVTDRIKELIKVKGNQVAPAEVREIRLQTPKLIFGHSSKDTCLATTLSQTLASLA